VIYFTGAGASLAILLLCRPCGAPCKMDRARKSSGIQGGKQEMSVMICKLTVKIITSAIKN